MLRLHLLILVTAVIDMYEQLINVLTNHLLMAIMLSKILFHNHYTKT